MRETDYIFRFFEFIHNILTYWYIAEIIFIILVTCEVFLFFAIMKDRKIFIFLFKDRMKFANKYLYFTFRQKQTFLKSFIYISKKQIKKIIWLLFILLVVGLIVAFIVWNFVFNK